MTLDELESTLPNGLHDAELLSLQVDYESRTASIDVAVDLSDVAEVDARYRPARLTFGDVQFVAADGPDSKDCAGRPSLISDA